MGDGLAVVGKHGFMQIDDNYLQLKIVGEGTLSQPRRDNTGSGGSGYPSSDKGTSYPISMPTNYNNTIDLQISEASAYDLTREITIKTSTNHGLSPGDQIMIQGVIGHANSATNPNGVQTVSRVEDSKTITYGTPGPNDEVTSFYRPNQPTTAKLKKPGPSAPYDQEDVLIFARVARVNGGPTVSASIGIDYQNNGTFYFIAPSGDTTWDLGAYYIDYKFVAFSPIAAEEINEDGGLEVYTESGDIAFHSGRESFVGEEFVNFSSSVSFSNAQPINNTDDLREEAVIYTQAQDLDAIKDYYALMNTMNGEIALHVNGQSGVGYEFKEWRNYVKFVYSQTYDSYISVIKAPHRQYGTKTDNSYSFNFNYNQAQRSLIIGKFR